jgi:hypothetical protein
MRCRPCRRPVAILGCAANCTRAAAIAAVAVEPTAGRRMLKIHFKVSVKALWKKEIFPAMAQSNN